MKIARDGLQTPQTQSGQTQPGQTQPGGRAEGMAKAAQPSQDLAEMADEVAALTDELHWARNMAENFARQLSAASARPWALVREFLNHSVLRLMLALPFVPRRAAERFARSAAKRDPMRHVAALDERPGWQMERSGVQRGRHLRAKGFRPYDPPPRVETDIRLIAFYLPQFHPFPENDAWWGKGFTEWTNVGKAMPAFEGHYQPHCPIHLGYYDLRVPSVMEEQAELAKTYGIGGFSYYFYWFGGKTLMEGPLAAMLANPAVDMPFCLTWANENWTRRWDGAEQDVLIGQTHSTADSLAFLHHLLPYFRDPRYIRIAGKPVLVIYRADIIPDIRKTTDLWRQEMAALGFDGIYLMAAQTFGISDPTDMGFDAGVEFPPHGYDTTDYTMSVQLHNAAFKGQIRDYDHVVGEALSRPRPGYKLFRSVMLSWDNSARKPDMAQIYANFSLARYKDWLSHLCREIAAQPDLPADEKLVFVNAWNEWAEGTHLEPDQRLGFAYLEATWESLTGKTRNAPRP